MRILVVEDDGDQRFALAAALRGAALAVDAAADLPAADQALRSTAYDCVVLDRMLPSGDAVAYVRQMRREGRTIPVLFLTEPTSNVVDVVVSQLRRKLGGPPLIHTVRGVGYRMQPPA
ncbi:DNA-binding response regulator [Kitasatospora sp. NPDC098652]|uniref:response regulator transcription factor n=1 Tax=Kitasatospora sp. NPDC098652 TaxID=3364095 RepID=UPI0038248708